MAERGRTFRQSFAHVGIIGPASLGLLALSCPAKAGLGGPANISVPQQRLEKAIQQLAVQTRRQVIFAPSPLTRKLSAPIKGYLTFEDALRRLLRGTGLTFRQSVNGVISIEPEREEAAPPATPAEPVDAPPNPQALVVIGPHIFEPVTFAGDMQLRPASFSLDALLDDGAGPSAQPGSAGQQGIVVRGIGMAGEATTAVYFGDVAITGPSGTGSDASRTTMDLALVDIYSVSTARTARNTEHGIGALAGEVEVEPEPAKLGKWEGKSTLGFSLLEGGDPGYQLAGTINAPVGENAAIRLTGYANRQGGFVDNIRTGDDNVNGDAMQGVRLITRYAPHADLDISALLTWQHRRISDSGAWSRALGRYNMDRQFLAPTTHDFLLGRLKAAYQMDHVRLTSISAYYRWKLDRKFDRTNPTLLQASDPAACQRYFALGTGAMCDPQQVDAFTNHVESLTPALLHIPITLRRMSQEVRLESRPGGPIDWTTGVMLDHRSEHFSSGLSVYTDDDAPTDYFGLREMAISRTQAAIFGDVAYHGDGGWLASLGLRYDWHRVSSRNDVLVPNIISGSIDSWPLTVKRSQGLYARAHLDLPVDDHVTLHWQATRSFRPAGVNTASVLVPNQRTFEADSLLGAEFGLKARWNPALSFTLMGYLNVWQDMQYRALSENRSHAYIVNVGNAAIAGTEMEMTVTPSDRTTIRLSSSIILSQIERIAPAAAAVGVVEKGDSIPFASTFRASLSLMQRWPLEDGRAITAKAHWQYQSGFHSTFSRNDPDYLATKGFLLLNTDAAYNWRDASISVSLKNLFNVRADLRALNNGFGAGQTFSYRPREFSLIWTRRW
ncbi:TonB-dependent receptor [Sphingobium sp. AP50]|uniref:TonB-dependent receptor n=1 Tax=Sphingobium sp. AP50 TaxID=1884369 RepID=UPI00210B81DC|nr:TonB-dependent receptor [Sphingobium sp. AP50]